MEGADNQPSTQGFSSPASRGDEIHLLDYWRVLLRRRAIVIITLLIVVVSTMALTFLATPRYRATSTIEIGRQGPEIVEFTDVLGFDPAGYKDFYQTQYKILQSRTVVRLAAERLDLLNRPEFIGRKRSPLARLIHLGRSRLFGGTRADDPLEPALEFIERNLSIAPVRNSYLVRISMTDRDPALAAETANAIAEAYQQFQRASRFDTTGEARDFLSKDVGRLQTEIADLEHELQEYAVENGIVGLSDDTQDLSQQALAEINARFLEASGRLVAAEARYRSVNGADLDAIPEVSESATLSELRRQYNQLEQDYARLSARFHGSWPARADLEERLQLTREQLERETRALVAQVGSDYRRTQREVSNLGRRLETQKTEVQRVMLVNIRHAALESEIASRRKVLGEMVGRQSETETSYRLKDTNSSNIRVVDRARPPQTPASPRKLLNFMLSLLLGAISGVGAAFLFDHLDNTVKSEQDLLRDGRLVSLGHIPLIHALRVVDGEKQSDLQLTSHLDRASHVDPLSGFSEAFRNLRTSVLLASPESPPRHIAVTSCGPGDGKSTVAVNLAIVLTQLGRRVLLVDADLRRPRLHKSFSLENAQGLSSFLSGNADVDGLVQETEVPNLRLVTSGPIPPNPSELLGSAALERFLAHFAERDYFDHLIFDSPPLLSVTDSTILSTGMDSTILVLRCGHTSREALAQSATRLLQARARVTGAVLNAASQESGYYYGRYHRYGQPYVAHPEDSVRDRRSPGSRRRRAG